MNDTTKTVKKLLKQALTLLEGGKSDAETSSPEVSMPEPGKVSKLKPALVAKIAEAYGIDTTESEDGGVALVTTAAAIVAGETDDLEKDAVNDLCAAVGIAPSKKQSATIEALKEFFDSQTDAVDGETDSESEDEEAEEEDEEEEEKPKKGKKSKPAADEEEDGEAEDDDSEGEEVSPKEQKKRLDAYNKVAKKKCKSYAELCKLCVGDDDEQAEWGTPYVRGEEAFCCGLPLKDVKIDDDDCGKCQVTGAVFKQDDDGDLVPVETEAEDEDSEAEEEDADESEDEEAEEEDEEEEEKPKKVAKKIKK